MILEVNGWPLYRYAARALAAGSDNDQRRFHLPRAAFVFVARSASDRSPRLPPAPCILSRAPWDVPYASLSEPLPIVQARKTAR